MQTFLLIKYKCILFSPGCNSRTQFPLVHRFKVQYNGTFRLAEKRFQGQKVPHKWILIFKVFIIYLFFYRGNEFKKNKIYEGERALHGLTVPPWPPCPTFLLPMPLYFTPCVRQCLVNSLFLMLFPFWFLILSARVHFVSSSVFVSHNTGKYIKSIVFYLWLHIASHVYVFYCVHYVYTLYTMKPDVTANFI